MTARKAAPTAFPHTLGHLRLQLTAWYVGTFFAILAILGAAMFAVITNQLDRDVDSSLRAATSELAKEVSTRGASGAIAELRIPKHALLVADTAGAPVAGPAIDPWLAQLARKAVASGGEAHASHENADGIRRGDARVVRTPQHAFVAIAVADEIELEDRYTTLIAAFGAGALGALILVAVGGWLLARKSAAPVERAIVHMRRFMADAAHELRTPITVMRGRAEVALQRWRDADEYVQALRGIERETVRLSRIVEDLLMLARADVGERPIEQRRVFLDDVTFDAAEAARVLATKKSIRIDIDDFEETPVVGDATLLRQLVIILLDNAIKFTEPHGAIHVSVRVSGTSAELTVADTGIGIPAEQLEHVFERFFRGDPSRTRGAQEGFSSDGAGLGLSIGEWIVKEHGGSIGITSQPGEGTRVIVTLPSAAALEPVSSP